MFACHVIIISVNDTVSQMLDAARHTRHQAVPKSVLTDVTIWLRYEESCLQICKILECNCAIFENATYYLHDYDGNITVLGCMCIHTYYKYFKKTVYFQRPYTKSQY